MASPMFYDARFDTEFRLLSILIALLSPTVLKRPEVGSLTVLPRWGSIAFSLVLRWLVLLGLLFAILYATKMSTLFSRRVLLTWAVLTPIPLIVVNIILNEMLRRFMMASGNVRLAVVAGFNEVSVVLAERVYADPTLGIRIEGYFDDRSADRLRLPANQKLLGGLSDLASYVNTHKIDVIFIALPMRQVQRVVDLLDELRDTTSSIYFVPDIFVMDLIQSRTADISGVPVIAMCETPFQGMPGLVKRMMDLGFSALGLALLSPFLLIIALFIKLDSRGPVIFRQRRYGLDGQIIDVLKFRTMNVTEDGMQIQQATRNDSRVTPVGRFLRRYSIDELPQLFNVLAGSMSLVGPRPHAVAHNEEYRRLDQGLYGAPQGAARHNRACAGQWLPWRDQSPRGHESADRVRPRVPPAMEADARHLDSVQDGHLSYSATARRIDCVEAAQLRSIARCGRHNVDDRNLTR